MILFRVKINHVKRKKMMNACFFIEEREKKNMKNVRPKQ